MLKPTKVANSLAITVGIARLIAALVAFLFPDFFGFVYKFLMFSKEDRFINMDSPALLASVLIPAILAWLIGYLFATVYNKLSKS